MGTPKLTETMSPVVKNSNKNTCLIQTTPPNLVVKARDGYMIVNLNDQYIGKSLIKYGEFSQMEMNLFEQLLEKTDNIVEVGSNIGGHTVGLCKLAREGQIWAFEPQRIIFQTLCGNIALNSILNCYCIECACSDRTDQPIIVPEPSFMHENNFGGISMIEESQASTRQRTNTLDAALPGLGSLKLLKIDAEGMEAKILTGSEKLIRRTRPVLYVENDRIENSKGLIEKIFSYEYRAFWHVVPMFNENNFNKVDENIFVGIQSVNMLCFPKEAVPDLNGFTEIVDPGFHPLKRF